jgi:N6-adenosine-specific RNA methylase IME4
MPPGAKPITPRTEWELITSGIFTGLCYKKYRAIHCDVPWKYLTWSKKGMGRSADNHYDTMTLQQIKDLPVQQIAAKDCVMFFWVTDPFEKLAHEILDAWGFTFKTVGFYWAKTNKDGSFFTGQGHWTRANPEHAFECYLGETEQEVERSFLATVGKPSRQETGKSVRRLIVSQRREHSRKPDEIFPRIEELVEGPYLDLFGRQQRPNWTVWSNQDTKFGGDPEAEALI